jgi:hypothetical protein
MNPVRTELFLLCVIATLATLLLRRLMTRFRCLLCRDQRFLPCSPLCSRATKISYAAVGVSSLNPAGLSHARQEAANSAFGVIERDREAVEANRPVRDPLRNHIHSLPPGYWWVRQIVLGAPRHSRRAARVNTL